VSPESPEDLAKALDEVFDDRQAAAEMGAVARQRCIESYSWDAMERILSEGLAF
jgi:glycosyltransferase involved in cell wall biosynthesis